MEREMNSSGGLKLLETQTVNEDILVVKDFIWKYILPSVCSVGLITNSANVFIFSQRKKLKNSIYKYFLLHSIIDLIYLTLCLGRFIIKMELISGVVSSYEVQLYEVYIYIFFTSSLALTMVLIQLPIATKRLLIIMNIKPKLACVEFRAITLSFILLSLALYVPVCFNFSIVPSATSDDGETKYVTKRTGINNIIALWIYSFTSYFRGFVAPLVLLALNIALVVKFRQMAQKKMTLQTEMSLLSEPTQSQSPVQLDQCQAMRQARRNLTKMIITFNCLFIISHSTTSLSFYHMNPSSMAVHIRVIVSNLILFTTHSLSFFIYLSFDKRFLEAVKSQLRRFAQKNLDF